MKRIAILTVMLLNPHSFTLYAQNMPQGNLQGGGNQGVHQNNQPNRQQPANQNQNKNAGAQQKGNQANTQPNRPATQQAKPAVKNAPQNNLQNNAQQNKGVQPAATNQAPPAPKEVPLLSSVKDYLDLDTINKRILEDNAYSHLFALTLPQADYITIGQEITMINHGKYLQAMKQSREDLNMNYVDFDDYLRARTELSVKLSASAKFINDQFSCTALNASNCYADIVKNRVQITRDINDNRVIYRRFLQAMDQSTYKAPPFNIHYPKLRYNELKKLSKLHLGDIVISLENGNIDQGLRDLLKATNLWKMMLQDSQNISDTLFASEQLGQIYHLTSNILDQASLKIAPNNPHIANILKPLTAAEENAIFTAIDNDMGMNLRSLSLINEKEVNKADPKLNYRRNANLNAYYFNNQMMLNNLKTMKKQDTITPKFQAALKNLKIDKIEYFEYAPIPYQQFLNEYSDMIIYHQLVQGKLEIKQKKITDISKYLIGNKLFGTSFRKASFTWDPKTRTASTPSAYNPKQRISIIIPAP